MYKCKECGCEFEEKPDFCDCGNDEFELVNTETKQELITPIQEIKQEEYIKPQPAKSIHKESVPKKSFSEQYPELKRIKEALDPISLCIFTLCIILSFVVIFFIWNPKEETASVASNTETAVKKDIPAIDKFWNNAVPQVKKEEPQKEEKLKPVEAVTNVVKQVIPTVPKQTVPTQSKAAPKTTVQSKTNQTNKTKSQPKPIVKQTIIPNKNTSTTQQQINAKKAEEAAIQKQKAEEAAKQAEALKAAQEAKRIADEQAKKAAEEQAKKNALQAKQELAQYKASLRNALGRKVDFTRVVGDGSCTVAFKIDSRGKLINRSFAQQSNNITLNDAVYNAVMSLPTFNPPPSAYNNETLNLNIRFYNGNFEISLK